MPLFGNPAEVFISCSEEKFCLDKNERQLVLVSTYCRGLYNYCPTAVLYRIMLLPP